MIQPKKITYREIAVIVSPAGHIDNNLAKKALQVIKKWGMQVYFAPHALHQKGRFSGTVAQRLVDLQQAMDNPDVKVIFCSRGGYGTVHLLEHLDFTEFKKHPKWIIGYSDITALHLLLQSKGYMSLHAPMAKHLAEQGNEDFAVAMMEQLLKGKQINYNIPVFNYGNLNRSGKGRGRLTGGNLAVFCGLLGSKLSNIPERSILFIEDIGEEPYKVDRYIYQLKQAGVFDLLSGLLVGQFTAYEEDPGMYASLYESIAEAVKEYDFPVFFDFPVGHVVNNYPLVMGGETSIEITQEQLILKQL